jgi:hypothetical protein
MKYLADAIVSSSEVGIAGRTQVQCRDIRIKIGVKTASIAVRIVRFAGKPAVLAM